MRAALVLAALAGLLGAARAQESAPPRPGEAGGQVDTLRQLYPALTACWHPPAGLAWLERTEITARFSLRRDGALVGAPRITFSALPADSPARQALTDATLDAIRRCTPVALTPGLGAAVAGRPLAISFIYEGPKGKGA